MDARPAWRRSAVWLPGLAVAVGAAIATAHGLYEVAVASRVPGPLAWLYPLITDGLALVAYTATARLSGSAARYAWSVVVIAAGLSGLAQAAFLAGDAEALIAPAWLRFGIGAWPAIAAAVVAHLLYLLADVHPDRSIDVGVQRSGPVVQSSVTATGPALAADELEAASSTPPEAEQAGQRSAAPAPAREHARTLARAHRARHGDWPTVSDLQAAAGVSRGTASAALKSLRDHDNQPVPLHLVSDRAQNHDDTSTSEQTQT